MVETGDSTLDLGVAKFIQAQGSMFHLGFSLHLANILPNCSISTLQSKHKRFGEVEQVLKMVVFIDCV